MLVAGVIAVIAVLAAVGAVLATRNEPEQRAVAGPTTTQSVGSTDPAQSTSTSPPASTTTTEPPVPDIRTLHLQDAALRQQCQGQVVTIKGNGERVPADGGEYAAEVLGVTYADLTGNGREDAIVEASCSYVGGNHPSSSVAIVSSEPAGPKQIGEPIDGASPTIHGRNVVVERPIYLDSDPMCCPSSTDYIPIIVDGEGWHESNSARPLGDTDKATTGGLGAVRVGDTYAEVAAAVSGPVKVQDDTESDGACVYVSIPSMSSEVSGLGGDGRLHSLEIDDPGIRTKSGLGIGSSEAEIQGAFPGKVSVTDHEYQEGGHYLSFLPDDGSGSVIFETDGSTVSRYRIGEPGWAGAVEGCL